MTQENSGSGVRINRYLAQCGLGARRDCEKFVRSGRVALNGSVITELSAKVIPETDCVTVDGKPVKPLDTALYIMLNKPRGFVVSRKGESDQKTVYELVKGLPGNLNYAGRLDSQSEGLLVLSTNGEFINRLTHPRYHVSKVYIARLDQFLDAKAILRFRSGIELEEGLTQPAQIDLIEEKSPLYRIILHEGRNRQIRRMAEALGVRVVELRRVAYGPLRLGNLERGAWRHLTRNELWKLKRDLKLTEL